MDFAEDASRLNKIGPLRKLRPTLTQGSPMEHRKLDVLNQVRDRTHEAMHWATKSGVLGVPVPAAYGRRYAARSSIAVGPYAPR